jgi:hypothetical protein
MTEVAAMGVGDGGISRKEVLDKLKISLVSNNAMQDMIWAHFRCIVGRGPKDSGTLCVRGERVREKWPYTIITSSLFILLAAS